ncbi:MAG: hypothetical protein V5A61_16375 [Haloarculaceae archaeon]|jgi:hypothetical protein
MRFPPYYVAIVVLVALVTAAVFGLDRSYFAAMALTMVSVVVIFVSVALLFGWDEEREYPGKA